ncbi:hypothetical protein NDU88_003645 [Pleurodeles waltl]|uniref:Uncharacterized protein n=1 Tax=Pleurodeles waltl TaxID=8319 RepID=A0AAV7NIT2_PLEWA|nr:hypothetical protein NDU88_003645 [Pleurodeles waltl]
MDRVVGCSPVVEYQGSGMCRAGRCAPETPLDHAFFISIPRARGRGGVGASQYSQFYALCFRCSLVGGDPVVKAMVSRQSGKSLIRVAVGLDPGSQKGEAGERVAVWGRVPQETARSPRGVRPPL